MTLPVSLHQTAVTSFSLKANVPDYEQQRKDLLRKHGIDLDDGNGIADSSKTRPMDKKEIERIMGGGDGEVGVFTWREKNRKKVRPGQPCPLINS